MMRRKLFLLLALAVFPSRYASAQGSQSVGLTNCSGGEEYVYLYQSLTNFTVTANLKCGVKVEIIGRDNGYIEVQTADGKQGYIPQSAITMAPPATPPRESAITGNQHPPASAATSNLLIGVLSPRAEIFGGYSYLNVDLKGLGGIPRQGVNGWQTSLSINANRWLAAEGAFGWYYKNNPFSVANLYDYSLLGGPRVSIRPIFLHALVGLDRLTASLSGSPQFSQNSISAALGGGVQWNFSPLWAVSSSADYILARHHLPGQSPTAQNNIRISGGIVLRFGGATR